MNPSLKSHQLEKSSKSTFGLFSELTDCELEKEDTEKAFRVYFTDYKTRFGGTSKGKGKGGQGKGASKGDSKGAPMPSGTYKGKGRDSPKMTIKSIVNGQSQEKTFRNKSFVKKGRARSRSATRGYDKQFGDKAIPFGQQNEKFICRACSNKTESGHKA